MVRERCGNRERNRDMAGFEDDGRGPWVTLEAGKKEENRISPRIFREERSQPYTDFIPGKTVLDFWPIEQNNKSILLQATDFEII